MALRDESPSSNLFALLRPHVTAFSESLAAHRPEEAKVGGKILHITPPLPPYMADEIGGISVEMTRFYTVCLDDGIGQIYVDVLEKFYEDYKELLQVGSLILVSGFVSVLEFGENEDRDNKKKSFKALKHEVHVRAFEISSLPPDSGPQEEPALI